MYVEGVGVSTPKVPAGRNIYTIYAVHIQNIVYDTHMSHMLYDMKQKIILHFFFLKHRPIRRVQEVEICMLYILFMLCICEIYHKYNTHNTYGYACVRAKRRISILEIVVSFSLL